MLQKYFSHYRPIITIVLALTLSYSSWSQTALFTDVPVSDIGTSNGIGQANTSRNIAIDNNGFIYVVFSGSDGVRVAKSENRGASFLPSIQVSSDTFTEPEIAVNNQGLVFVAWANTSGNVLLSRSIDGGVSYSIPSQINSVATFAASVHMATFNNNVYIVDQSGQNLYVNTNNGLGPFTLINLPTFVYADVLTDQNGVVYAPRDNPSLELYSSTDNGISFNQIPLQGTGDVFFSSYTLSDGPCGSFLFTAGDGNTGYKIDLSTGNAEAIIFGSNNNNVQGRTLFADQQGTIIDGYKDDTDNLVMSISFNQGVDFEAPIVISDGDSHNIDRNTTFNDIVVAYSKNGQVFVSVYTDFLKGISIVEPIPGIDTCSGTDFDLDFTINGLFAPSTEFNAILSDEFGDFSNGINVGQTITNTDGTISISLPNTLATGSQYRLLIESLADCTQSQSITINVSNIQLTDIETVGECEDENGVAQFNLTALIPSILDGQTGIDVSFYTDENNANTSANPITNPNNFSVSANTKVWVRGQSQFSNICFTVFELDLEVFNLPQIVSPVRLEQCDLDQDGITLFNLTEANSLITNDSTNSFTYYTSQNDAELGSAGTEISNFTAYGNPTPINAIVFARVETTNGCIRVSQIDLAVEATQIPQNFEIVFESCDDSILGSNTDGISSFDFSTATAQIENLFPTGQNLETTYYLNENDALQEVNAIADIFNFRNEFAPNSQTLWVRVDNLDINGCQGLGPHIVLNVLEVPNNNPITNYELCSSSSEATFNLTTKNSEVIAGQTKDFVIKYYTSLANAENDLPITTPNAFVSAGQTIFVRAVFDDNSDGVENNGECFNAVDMQFDVIVNPNPITFQPDRIEQCSTQIDTVYNLLERENQITGGNTNVTVQYYETQLDVTNNNPITNPQNYLSTEINTDIIVVVSNGNNCSSEEILTLNTTLFDSYNLAPATIEECEVDNDGFDNFDLTRIEPDILNLLDTDTTNDLNASDYVFTYYELEADASLIDENIANAISNPQSFVNTTAITQTIFVRVTPISGTNQQCFVVIPFDIIVNPVPEIAIEDEYVICLSGTNQVIDNTTTTFLPNPPIDTQLDSNSFSFQWYAGNEEDVIDNPSNFIINGATAAAFSPTQGGFYTVVATNNSTGCTISGTTKVVSSYPPESVTIDLISNAFSGNNTLQVSVTGNGDYVFSLDYGPWQSDNTFSNVTGGEHEILARDLYNCNVIIVTKSIIDYPLYFTPNNDGNHDTWNIESIESQPNAKIYIFDRYGKLLKQLSPTGSGWDGTYNGNNMPSSDYWFSVEYTEPIDGIKRVFKAHFTLKR